jgi:hypothetical protein
MQFQCAERMAGRSTGILTSPRFLLPSCVALGTLFQVTLELAGAPTMQSIQKKIHSSVSNVIRS